MYTDRELREIAIMALGSISVDLFQPGDDERDLVFTQPDYDYLVTRDGTCIGYGELAIRYGNALKVMVEARAVARAGDHTCSYAMYECDGCDHKDNRDAFECYVGYPDTTFAAICPMCEHEVADQSDWDSLDRSVTCEACEDLAMKEDQDFFEQLEAKRSSQSL